MYAIRSYYGFDPARARALEERRAQEPQSAERTGDEGLSDTLAYIGLRNNFV